MYDICYYIYIYVQFVYEWNITGDKILKINILMCDYKQF